MSLKENYVLTTVLYLLLVREFFSQPKCFSINKMNQTICIFLESDIKGNYMEMSLWS